VTAVGQDSLQSLVDDEKSFYQENKWNAIPTFAPTPLTRNHMIHRSDGKTLTFNNINEAKTLNGNEAGDGPIIKQ
jgi:hypothetical protein